MRAGDGALFGPLHLSSSSSSSSSGEGSLPGGGDAEVHPTTLTAVSGWRLCSVLHLHGNGREIDGGRPR